MSQVFITAEDQGVPAKALVISGLALLVPVGSSFWIPDWTSSDGGTLIWLTALIPAFLLSYYRGLQGVAVALAGGMAVITTTQLSIVLFQIEQPDYVQLLLIVGIYLAISLGIAILAEVLQRQRAAAERLAFEDRLTGIANRRLAEATLVRVFAGAERGAALSIVLFDLDHFKAVNDGWGHSEGDRLIQQFARILAENTRREDLCARWGGEEFIVILTNKSRDAAVKYAEEILARLRGAEFEWGIQTVSAGVAEYQKGMGSYEILIAAADNALYEAKEMGRDRVIASTSGDRPRSPQKRLSVTDLAPAAGGGDRFVNLVIVEDDEGLRRAIVRAVCRFGGYTVFDTGSPFKAIEHCRTADQVPDLVLTDIVMPEMNGLTMMKRISQDLPEIRVVYMSGYNQSKIDWPGAPGEVVAFLAKPIELEHLRDVLSAVATAEKPAD